MATRAATTILLLTRRVIVRADFSWSNALLGIWSQARPNVQDWPMLVEIALGLGAKAGNKVFILSSDFWTQTLTLPNVSTTAMSPGELAAALNFEAESLSGQSAFESMVAVQVLPSDQGYWIVQARTTDFEQASEIVARAGARLGGIGHPGGLPHALNSAGNSSQQWARMELWPDAVIMLRGDSSGSAAVQVLNSDPQLGRWKAEWSAWCQGLASTEQETLAGPAMSSPTPTLSQFFALDEEKKLASWLSAWAEFLNGKAVGVPLFRPVRKPLSVGVYWTIAIGLAFLMIVACGALHYWLDGTVQATNSELKHLQDHTKDMTEVKKQVDELKSKQMDLQTQIEKLEKSLRVLGTHRQRLAKLLTTLREIHPPDLYVEKIEVEAGEPRLRGHCLQPELADQFANRLAQALLDQGWEVQSPKKEALKLAANGGPWSFDIHFKSAKDMTLDTRVETKKGKGR